MPRSEHSIPLDGDTSRFPVFARILRKYFPDKADDLTDKYRLVGESSIEFKGLREEIEEAIKSPSEAATFLNEVLGTDLTPEKAEDLLIETYDQLTQSGEYSQERVEEEAARIRAAKPSTDELMDYYVKRRINLKGPFARLSAPLWVYPVIAIPVAFAASAAIYFTPGDIFILGPVIHWAGRALVGLAVIVIFLSVLTMYTLRSERLDPEKERRKEEAFEKRGEPKPAKGKRGLIARTNPFK